MNKQQLASKIWESANKMRSKIEANDYKDYILGFIFYKYLSTKELQTLENMHYPNDRLKEVTEQNSELVLSLQNKNGYFIEYNNLSFTFNKDSGKENINVALDKINKIESDRAIDAETNINNSITAEISRATTKENTLQENIDSENESNILNFHIGHIHILPSHHHYVQDIFDFHCYHI